MTKHDKIEHELPNGDILEVDATNIRPEVEKAFDEVRKSLHLKVGKAYRELREADKAA